MADAAIGALGAAAGALRWGAYQALLGQFVRIMQRSDGKVRCACTSGPTSSSRRCWATSCGAAT